MQLSPTQLNQLTQLRQTLHQHPELSGEEVNTAQRVKQFISRYEPSQIIANLGGHGVAAVYKGAEPGPTAMIRADLDALPIQETSHFPHRSQQPNTAHLCGHDGHATIVAGLASWLQQHPPDRGQVVLLFQPAEETGAGAYQVTQAAEFDAIRPDYVFALHNLPRYPFGQVLLCPTGFAAASTGIIIRLQGKPSHAAHPEDGRSPALAMAQLVTDITQLPKLQDFQDFVLTTVIHARLGEIAFGTTPGEAEVMATLRSYRDDDMAILTQKVESMAQAIAIAADLQVDISYTETFPATRNHPEATDIVKQAAIACGYDYRIADSPFRWSEDFGY
ncbi:amidohydrolase, partial [filamentous cyanobacterium CCP5]